MKHTKNSSVSLKLHTFPKTGILCFSGFLSCFLMFFCGGMGICLSLRQPFASSPAPSGLILFMGAVSLLYSLLFLLRRGRKFYWILVLLLSAFAVFFLCFHKKITDQGSGFMGFLRTTLEKLYHITIFSQAVQGKEPDTLFFCFATSCLLFLLFFAVLKEKRGLFLLFLALFPLAGFVLNTAPSVSSLGFLCASFFLWDSVFPAGSSLSRKKTMPFPGLSTAALAVLLYIFCAGVLTPRIAPLLFQSNHYIYEKTNLLLQAADSLFSRDAVSEPVENSLPFPGFSYEKETDRQLLDNSAPSYRNRTMFQLRTSVKPESSVYLRGFVGKSYTEASWSAPEEDSWNAFLLENSLSETDVNRLFSIPYAAGSSQKNQRPASITLTPAFSPAFTYLPYGSNVPKGSVTDDSNLLQNRALLEHAFSCIPLSLSSGNILYQPDLTAGDKAAETAYRKFVYQEYLDWDSASVPHKLEEEVSALPVFQSMPDSPSFADIQAAADEISSFLRDKASYSLSLSPVPEDSRLLDEFLYEQKKGFCVHFATAGTLLFRMYGIPARYVSGYVISPDSLQKGENQQYSCQVPDSSAHAWTEIYVGNGGWLPVEVTPSASESPVPATDTEHQEEQQEEENPQQETKENQNEYNSQNEHDNQMEDGSQTEHDSQTETGQSLEHTKSPSGKSGKQNPLLPVLQKLGSVLLPLFFLLLLCFLLLCTRRILLFRKRTGYFERSPSARWLRLFNSLLDLWKLQLHITSKEESTLKQLLTEKLPEEERESFHRLYRQAEAICFGEEIPAKQQIRELRRTYARVRKRLYRDTGMMKMFYYMFFIGL